MTLQRFVSAIGASRTLAGRDWRAGVRIGFPWVKVGCETDGTGYRDVFLFVVRPLHLLFKIEPAWNRYILTPLIDCGVLALNEGDFFRNARVQPVSRWFRSSGTLA